MKKLVCLMLALMLCVSAFAMAESAPSKTTTDLTKFDVIAENQPNDPAIYLLPVNALSADELPTYEAHMDIVSTELAKLSSAGVDSYFEGATDGEGNAVDLRAMLGLDANAALNVFEFCQVVAGGFQEDCGKVTATLLFPTPYAAGEKVDVMIGIVNMQADNTYTVDWQAFAGVGKDVVGQEEICGAVEVEVTPEIAVKIENNMALMAVVSK